MVSLGLVAVVVHHGYTWIQLQAVKRQLDFAGQEAIRFRQLTAPVEQLLAQQEAAWGKYVVDLLDSQIAKERAGISALRTASAAISEVMVRHALPLVF